MHQYLKFNLSLNKIDTDEKDKKGQWQPILATEYIGTFFMIYMRLFSEEPFGGIHIVKAQFYLQNYRGNIRMGLGNLDKISGPDYVGDVEDFDYRMDIPVTPFHNKDWDTKVYTLQFPKGIIAGQTTFETEVDYDGLPRSIFNPDKLNESTFLHPLYFFREGENLQHVYYKKDVSKDPNDSELYGGQFDNMPLTLNGITIRPEGNNESRFNLGTAHSPTCDAKRTVII